MTYSNQWTNQGENQGSKRETDFRLDLRGKTLCKCCQKSSATPLHKGKF